MSGSDEQDSHGVNGEAACERLNAEAESACERCLRRPWLLARLAAHLDRVGRRVPELLELDDEDLVEALAGRRKARLDCELDAFDSAGARAQARRVGIGLVCRCHALYPSRLWALGAPPAVLHVAGGLERFLSVIAGEPIAVVGTRRPSPYGVDVARALGRGLASSGVTVVSGMAQGIDAAAHDGALLAQGPTVAVLAGSADRAYPASCRRLHRQIMESGAVISELPPGVPVWRWMFPARNRIIAALSAMTVVVEAGERSGALLTASWATRLGIPVGAVPGRVTSRQAAGPHRLLKEGAHLVRGAQDVVDSLYGAGAPAVSGGWRAEVEPDLQPWLDAIASGHDTPAALARLGLPPEQALAVLSRLELEGHVRREAGGRFAALP
jgi:DNA processing protein